MQLQPELSRQLDTWGFISPNGSSSGGLVINITGEEKGGKTRCALMGDGPILYINMDRNNEELVREVGREKDIRVLDLYKLWPTALPNSRTEVQNIFSGAWDQYYDIRMGIYKSFNSGTVVIDTDTREYDLLRYARIGARSARLAKNQRADVWEGIKRDLQSLLGAANQSSMTTVYISRLRDEYVDGDRTGKRVRNGREDLGYDMTLNLVCGRNQDQNGTHYYTTVLNSGIKGMELNGKIFWSTRNFPGVGEIDQSRLDYISWYARNAI